MVGGIDPVLMGHFRRSIADPRCFWNVCRICRSYRMEDLRHPRGAYSMVDRLSRCCNVPISREQRDYAANWLMNCGVNPQCPVQSRRMWGIVRGGWL
ncbi:MAG TPA: hypothetical protein GXX18_03150 [Bacillales bacterium]|nr:hypothetical protein [Bacillales bacterium]